ncbi:MAG: hypothetical protein IT290_02615 [Deltaproteobacteria bacterium]|nr:hypothetical protein [Deltaproteobacteria bacterium]
MAEVASAGTLVAAVLETAGYVAQAEILASFQDFLDSVGLFLFILSAIGGLTSIAIFGSYRNGLYLLLAPPLFYVMISTFAVSNGVYWQIGGGSPRNAFGEQVPVDQSQGSVSQVVTVSNGTSGVTTVPAQLQIQVAAPFLIVTELIGRLVNALADVIMSYENDRDLLFIARMQALEVLISGDIKDRRLLRMFQGDFIDNCNKMFDASLALSRPDLSLRREQELTQELTTPNRPLDASTRALYQQQLLDMARQRAIYRNQYNQAQSIQVNPGAAVLEYARETQVNPASAIRTGYLARMGQSSIDGIQPVAMTCGEMWAVVGEAIMTYADTLQESVLAEHSTMLAASDRGYLCVELARKMGSTIGYNERDNCDLVTTTAIFLIRNAVAERSRSGIVNRLADRLDGVETIREGTVLPFVLNPDDWTLVAGQSDYQTTLNPDKGFRREAMFRHERGMTAMLPIVRLDEVTGTMDAALVWHQRFQARELRAKIFSFALQLPYWQGVLLFFLAMGYPFAAFLLVIPGRAGTFLVYPLAWLWVKSWDVGFAIVMVFDRVLWNLFPSYDFERNDFIATRVGEQPLPTVLSEAFKVDPAFNVHAYFFMVSIAMLAIPGVTGYVILKTRERLFDNFIGRSGMEGVAEGAGEQAGRTFGGLVNNLTAQRMKEMQGLNYLQNTYRGEEGLAGSDGSRAQMSEKLAELYAYGNLLKTVASQRATLGGAAAFSANMLTYRNDLNTKRAELMGEEALASAEYQRAFNPVWGRHGYQQRTEAMLASMDADRGYEIYDQGIGYEAAVAQRELMKKKMKVAQSALSGQIAGTIMGIGKLPNAGAAARTAALGAGVLPSTREFLMDLAESFAGEGDRHFLENQIEGAFSDPERRAQLMQGLDIFARQFALDNGLDPENAPEIFGLPSHFRSPELINSEPVMVEDITNVGTPFTRRENR